jgi:hypothetical protein
MISHFKVRLMDLCSILPIISLLDQTRKRNIAPDRNKDIAMKLSHLWCLLKLNLEYKIEIKEFIVGKIDQKEKIVLEEIAIEASKTEINNNI